MRAGDMLEEWRERLSRAELLAAQPVKTVADRGRLLAARISLPVLRFLVRRYSRADVGAGPFGSQAGPEIRETPGGVVASTEGHSSAPGRPARSVATIRSALENINGGREPLVPSGPALVMGPDHMVAVETFRHFLVALAFKRALKRQRIPSCMSWGSRPWVVYAPRESVRRALEIYETGDYHGVDAREGRVDTRLSLLSPLWCALLVLGWAAFALNPVNASGASHDALVTGYALVGVAIVFALLALFGALRLVFRWYIIRGQSFESQRRAENCDRGSCSLPEPR